MLVTDLETTGLKPEIHSIISIGAIQFENPSNTFYMECRPYDGAVIDPVALNVNGATWLNDPLKPSLEEALRAFLSWTYGISGNKELAGSNIGFDISFLKDTARRYNITCDFGHHPVDVGDWFVMSLCLRELPVPEKFRTDTILEYVGLQKEPVPHIGIVGAKMEAEAFLRLLGRGLLKEYESFPIPEYLQNMKKATDLLRTLENRVIQTRSLSVSK